MKYSMFVSLALALAASASPRYVQRADFTLRNGEEAIALNQKFATLTPDSPCTSGDVACVGQKFASCVNSKFFVVACNTGEVCAALPLVNSPGTSVTCTTPQDRDARIAATGATGAGTGAAGTGDVGTGATSTGAAAGGADDGATGATTTTAAAASTSTAADATGTAAAGNNAGAGEGAAAGSGAGAGTGAAAGGDDAQSSLTLLQSVIATGFANDGQDQPTAGQVPSLTSTNNFINFCATVPTLPITNGKQIETGSCNPAPMGVIAAKSNMPSSKFLFPKNFGTVPVNTTFTIQMAINNLETGHFVNAQENYFAAPQVVNAQGNIQGHSHVVVDKLTSLAQTTPTDPANDFVFFKGLNDPAANGVLSVEVPGGLPAGTYRLASINAAANHQPALVAVAQHGSLDDMIYFTVA